MGAVNRSIRLLEATPADDTQEIAAVLGEVQETYSTTDIMMPPDEQINTLYTREYAAENGYDGIGQQAETLLAAKNERRLQQRLVQVPSAITGLAAADLTYADTVKDEITAFLAAHGTDHVAELMGNMPEVVTGIPLAAVSGYAAGTAFYRYHADDGIPLDADYRYWFSDPVETLREELLETYDIDTYRKNPTVPKRYG